MTGRVSGRIFDSCCLARESVIGEYENKLLPKIIPETNRGKRHLIFFVILI